MPGLATGKAAVGVEQEARRLGGTGSGLACCAVWCFLVGNVVSYRRPARDRIGIRFEAGRAYWVSTSMSRTWSGGRMGDIIGEIEVERPDAARMYDYYLGGAANFEADRDAAEAGLAVFAACTRLCAGQPRVPAAGSELSVPGRHRPVPRSWLGNPPRLATCMTSHTGTNPQARVAYVEIEPVAVAHSRLLLDDDPRVSVNQADIRQSTEVLTAPGVTGLLDFTRPVAGGPCGGGPTLTTPRGTVGQNQWARPATFRPALPRIAKARPATARTIPIVHNTGTSAMIPMINSSTPRMIMVIPSHSEPCSSASFTICAHARALLLQLPGLRRRKPARLDAALPMSILGTTTTWNDQVHGTS